jgi:predicted Holliday junction resolvase-like endonuclease
MIRYIILIIVIVFVCVLSLILYFYLKKDKDEYEIEPEIESKKAENIWELQKKNLELDLREANDLGAFQRQEKR